MDELTDSTLNGVLNKEPQSIALLFEAWADLLRRAAKGTLRNCPPSLQQSANLCDILQNVYISFMKRDLSRVNTDEHLYRLLILITQKKAIEIIRRHYRGKDSVQQVVETDLTNPNVTADDEMASIFSQIPDEHIDSLAESSISELFAPLRRLDEQLPSACYQSIVLHRLSGKTKKEIQSEFGLSRRKYEAMERDIKRVYRSLLTDE